MRQYFCGTDSLTSFERCCCTALVLFLVAKLVAIRVFCACLAVFCLPLFVSRTQARTDVGSTSNSSMSSLSPPRSPATPASMPTNRWVGGGVAAAGGGAGVASHPHRRHSREQPLPLRLGYRPGGPPPEAGGGGAWGTHFCGWILGSEKNRLFKPKIIVPPRGPTHPLTPSPRKGNQPQSTFLWGVWGQCL